MTTASTSTVVDHTSDAGFRAWVAEIITMLFTTLGVTQTGDTGQINTTTVTRPGTSTMGGYVIGSFNDTAQATSPLFFKIQFGTGSAAASPAFEIQLGTGSNGSGTLTGVTTVTGFCTQTSNSPVNPGVTAYLTRGCYSAAAGVLWLSWKMAGAGTTNVTLGGFFIARSHNASGVVTTDAVNCITNNNATSGQTTQGAMFGISYLQSLAFNPGGASGMWAVMPFNVTVTLFSSNSQVGPGFQYTPVLGVSNWLAIAINGEFGLNSTASMTLVGATAHTYIAAGSPFALNSITALSYTANGGGAASYTVALLWE